MLSASIVLLQSARNKNVENRSTYKPMVKEKFHRHIIKVFKYQNK
jgi:hypothetical protein